MCRTLRSTGTAPPRPCLSPSQKKKIYRLSIIEVFFELTGSTYFSLIISCYGEFMFQKDIVVWHSVSLLSHILAAKFRDCIKITESKWLDQFLQQTVLCVSVKGRYTKTLRKWFLRYFLI
jgi:hypothetical protein